MFAALNVRSENLVHLCLLTFTIIYISAEQQQHVLRTVIYTNMTNDPRYPIGKYLPEPFSEGKKEDWLSDIRHLPQLLENALLNLDEQQLQTPYRQGGWTIQQLVHHVADSH